MTEIAEYFEEVAAENAKMAVERPGDRRLAINAIMTLDGFFGTLHATLLKQGQVSQQNDDEWKEALACMNTSYRLLRDTAFALKHGELTRKAPRLVRRSEQVVKVPGAFSSGFSKGFQIDIIWIEATDTNYRAWKVIEDVLEFARDQMKEGPVG